MAYAWLDIELIEEKTYSFPVKLIGPFEVITIKSLAKNVIYFLLLDLIY